MLPSFSPRSQNATSLSVNLRQVLPDAEFLGCRDIVVSEIAVDARQVQPGQLFIALRDLESDGHELASIAIERGAIAIVCERPLEEGGSRQVIVHDSRSTLGKIAHALAGNPSRSLPTIGIGGGRAVTATTLFLEAIFEADGRRVGVSEPTSTTDCTRRGPKDSRAFAAIAASIRDRGSELGILAFTTSELEAYGTAGLMLDSALVVTEEISDSDTHENVMRAMARMTRSVAPGGWIAIQEGDPNRDLLLSSNPSAQHVTFGIEGAGEVSASIEHQDLDGTQFRLGGLDRERTVRLRPLGPQNLLAAIGAAALARKYGVSDGAIVAGLESISRIPGTVEPIAFGARTRVFADLAETAASLREALTCLRHRVSQEVICVLSVTEEMTQVASLVAVAEASADRVVLTRSDSLVSSEALESWLGQFRRPGRVRVCLDRNIAIETALQSSGPQDVVVLLGSSKNDWQTDRVLVHNWIRNVLVETRKTA